MIPNPAERLEQIRKRLREYKDASIGPTVVGTMPGSHHQWVTVAMKSDGKSLEANCGIMSDRNRIKATLFAFAADDIEFLLTIIGEVYPTPTKKDIDQTRRMVEAESPESPCPFDTDGDGNCGRPGCPHCGRV